MSTLFGILTIGSLYALCRQLGGTEKFSLAIAALFAANPLTVVYSVNGMSEMALLLPMVWSTRHLVMWLQTQRPGNLLLAACGMGATMWVRYEAIPFVAALVAGVIAFAVFERSALWSIEKTEGVILALAVPAVYSLLLWFFFNWQIMGDPLYFLRGEYSFLNTSSGSASQFGYHDLGRALMYDAKMVTVCAAWYIPLVVYIAYITVKKSLYYLWIPIFASLALPAFELLILYKSASSFGFLRYFMYPLPFMCAMMVVLRAELSSLLSERRHHHAHHASRLPWLARIPGLLIVLLFLSNCMTFWGMRQPDIGKQDYAVVRRPFDASYKLAPKQSFDADRAIAAFLDSNPGGLILTDSYNGFAIILASRHPDQFVTTGDRNFPAVLARPRNYVDRILIQSPGAQNLTTDQINRAYPELYRDGAPWAYLEQDWNAEFGCRMYRLIRSIATVGS